MGTHRTIGGLMAPSEVANPAPASRPRMPGRARSRIFYFRRGEGLQSPEEPWGLSEEGAKETGGCRERSGRIRFGQTTVSC
jgi:hypothetical protein